MLGGVRISIPLPGMLFASSDACLPWWLENVHVISQFLFYAARVSEPACVAIGRNTPAAVVNPTGPVVLRYAADVMRAVLNNIGSSEGRSLHNRINAFNYVLRFNKRLTMQAGSSFHNGILPPAIQETAPDVGDKPHLRLETVYSVSGISCAVNDSHTKSDGAAYCISETLNQCSPDDSAMVVNS